MDVFGPVLLSSCVIDPRCFLCDLFLPLFSQQDRHLGIWHNATWRVAFILQFIFSRVFPSCPCVRMSHVEVAVLVGLCLGL
jgi:hypothetical protein